MKTFPDFSILTQNCCFLQWHPLSSSLPCPHQPPSLQQMLLICKKKDTQHQTIQSLLLKNRQQVRGTSGCMYEACVTIRVGRDVSFSASPASAAQMPHRLFHEQARTQPFVKVLLRKGRFEFQRPSLTDSLLPKISPLIGKAVKNF